MSTQYNWWSSLFYFDFHFCLAETTTIKQFDYHDSDKVLILITSTLTSGRLWDKADKQEGVRGGFGKPWDVHPEKETWHSWGNISKVLHGKQVNGRQIRCSRWNPRRGTRRLCEPRRRRLWPRSLPQGVTILKFHFFSQNAIRLKTWFGPIMEPLQGKGGAASWGDGSQVCWDGGENEG